MGSCVNLCFKVRSLLKSVSSCLWNIQSFSQTSICLTDFCIFNDKVLLL